MFTEFIPNDRPIAFLEIGIILLVTFLLGFVCGRIILSRTSKKVDATVSSNLKSNFEERDIIIEPTAIRATLTRERGGTLAEKKAIEDTSLDETGPTTDSEEEEE